MKKYIKKLYSQQKKRYLRKIIGSAERPRLSIFRSHKHIYAQLIDDQNGNTLAFSSTLDPAIINDIVNSANQEAAYSVGEALGKKALLKNITLVAFDRGNKPYHGRIKQIAEGARKAGLIF